jgi:hypothetical protein
VRAHGTRSQLDFRTGVHAHWVLDLSATYPAHSRDLCH